MSLSRWEGERPRNRRYKLTASNSNMSEQTEFLKDLDVKPEDILDKPIVDVKTEEVETPDDTEQKLKNRRERRLNERLQAEREANIALNARLETLAEAKNLGGEEADYLKRVRAIYGDATPEAKEATNILIEALQGLENTAVRKALDKVEEERGNESKAVRKEEMNLDDIEDHVEEEYGINMSAEGSAYFTLLEKLSPKDDDGNIIEYADPDATAELYLSRKERSSSRAKELASRSMTRGGASEGSKLETDSVERFLKENNII